MKIITVNVSTRHLKMFQALLESGLIPSRSEAMRMCITLGMREIFRHLKLMDDMEEHLEEHRIFDTGLNVGRPTKPEVLEDETSISLSDLRDKYPEINDYKFMNESAEIRNFKFREEPFEEEEE